MLPIIIIIIIIIDTYLLTCVHTKYFDRPLLFGSSIGLKHLFYYFK